LKKLKSDHLTRLPILARKEEKTAHALPGIAFSALQGCAVFLNTSCAIRAARYWFALV
jgi:hypothetical protein